MRIALLHAGISGLILFVGQSNTQVKTDQPVTTHKTTKHTTHTTKARTAAKTPTSTHTASTHKPVTNTVVATKPEPPAPPTGSAVSPAQAKAALEFHNSKRAEVGVPPLQWSPQLALAAQAWADHLAKDLECKMQHTPNNPYGENLFAAKGGAFTAVDASQLWYGEKQKYAGGALTKGNFAPSGHYTQMVWQATTEIGIGQSTCNGTLVIVAEYSPHGNVLGQKPY